MSSRITASLLVAAVIFGCDPAPAADAAATAARDTSETAENLTPSDPEAFEGQWEVASDDGTYVETAELEVSGGQVTGILRSLERGYYSGRVTVTAEVAMRAVPRAGGLDIMAWDVATGSEENGTKGRGFRRGDYLILQIGDGETSYARPGVSVVRSAEGSAAAERLAAQIAGRIYSSSTTSSGRGAFVGSRVRLALCSDASIALDVSDLATTGGPDAVDIGGSMSRRGEWGIVLLAGIPVVRAQWSGTGSSYSLTRYFRIRPQGSAAVVDGTLIPVSGTC